MNPLRFLLLIAAVALPGRLFAEPAGSVDEQVFFSFDDVSIPWRDNLKLSLEQPKRYPGNPVLKSGPPGSVDCNGAILYGTVFEDGGKLRMWYIAWPQPDKRYAKDTSWPHRPIAYAESSDGIHWDKPKLGLVEFCGSKDNNLVSIEPADHPFAVANDYVSVLRDDADSDPARRTRWFTSLIYPSCGIARP